MNFITVSFVWFACSIIFYGLNINIKNLDGNIYFQGMYINFFEIFFVILSGVIANTELFGRKKTILLYLSIALTCLFILIFIPTQHLTFDILLMATRYSVSSVFCIIYYVSSEVYPTVLRSKGLAMNSVISRIGGILAPSIIENIDFRYVLIIYCILNIISLILTFFLEETYNKPLKDNIPEEILKYN
jgi:OCT family organic cation transporter-like MFS transporter 4/5